MRTSPRLVTILAVAALMASTVATSMPAGAVDPVPYIVGGTDVIPADDTPWLAAVLDGDVGDAYLAQICTGTLISPSHVLTAGHCVKDEDGLPVLTNYEVSVGILDLDDVTPSDRYEAVATTHPSWTGTSGIDLAVLTLSTPILHIEPLAIRAVAPGIGDAVTAYGWGGTLAADRDNNSYPMVAQKGTMTVTTDYGSTTGCGFGPGAVEHSHQFCFGDPAQAVCFGDSGGPIVMFDAGEPYLVGATSQGPLTCNLSTVDEIAERIIDSVPWLETFIGPGGCGWNPESAGLAAYEGWTVPCWFAPASAASLPFVDVVLTAFYIEGVKWLWSNSITTGTSTTEFSPDNPVTRGQAAAFLWRFSGEPAAAATTFGDVFAGWQLVPVGWMAEWGFTTGTSATTFSPDESVTRAQLVTFLWRLLGEPVPSGASGFPDVAAGAFYSDAVAWAAENGVTTGYPDGTFKPDREVTRGELATFSLRLALLVEALAT